MKFRYILIAGWLLVGVACSSNPKDPDREKDREWIQSELGQEMSLKADRDQLSELRQDIPEQKQVENDELALYLNLMKQGQEKPNLVRDRFDVLVQKKRARFRAKVQRLREDYTRQERERREKFLDEAKSARESVMRDATDSKDRRRFMANQDKDRQRFFADERERRRSFESELSAQSKDFDGYMRERVREFNEQYRLYTKKFYDKPKSANPVTGETDEFRKLDKMNTTPLGTED